MRPSLAARKKTGGALRVRVDYFRPRDAIAMARGKADQRFVGRRWAFSQPEPELAVGARPPLSSLQGAGLLEREDVRTADLVAGYDSTLIDETRHDACGASPWNVATCRHAGHAMFSNKSDIHFRASCIASDRQSLIRR